MGEYAVYSVQTAKGPKVIRLSRVLAVSNDFTDEEQSIARDFFKSWILEKGYAGMAGHSVDSYELFLDYLTERFGNASMIEKHYTWTPGMLYSSRR